MELVDWSSLIGLFFPNQSLVIKGKRYWGNHGLLWDTVHSGFSQESPLLFPFFSLVSWFLSFFLSVSVSFVAPLTWFIYFRQLPKVFAAQDLGTYLHCDAKGSHFEITTFPWNEKEKRFLVAMVMSTT